MDVFEIEAEAARIERRLAGMQQGDARRASVGAIGAFELTRRHVERDEWQGRYLRPKLSTIFRDPLLAPLHLAASGVATAVMTGVETARWAGSGRVIETRVGRYQAHITPTELVMTPDNPGQLSGEIVLDHVSRMLLNENGLSVTSDGHDITFQGSAVLVLAATLYPLIRHIAPVGRCWISTKLETHLVDTGQEVLLQWLRQGSSRVFALRT